MQRPIFEDRNEDFCGFCGISIDTPDFKQVSQIYFHESCLDQANCDHCGESVKGVPMENLKICGRAILHEGCNPLVCAECNHVIEDPFLCSYARRKTYHEKCLPKCYICYIDTYNSELENCAEGYICENCDPTPCFLCGGAIGYQNQSQMGDFKIHRSCRTFCLCGDLIHDETIFPTRSIRMGETTPIITRELREKFFALISAEKRTKKLGKDVLGIVVNMMFNGDTSTLEAVRERHGVDFDIVCTPLRCLRKNKCGVCNAKLSYTSLDRKSCSYDSCSEISVMYHRTMRDCFPKANIGERYTDRYSVRRMTESFIKYRSEMTPQQISIYSVNASQVALLMSLRRE
jgi:hypothetical protein